MIHSMKQNASHLLTLGALMLGLSTAAAGEPASADIALVNFSRAFTLPEKQQVRSRMISNSSSFALTLQITPGKGFTVSSLDLEGLSMTDRMGNDLQPDFLTHASGESDKGQAYVDIFARDTMYGDWVHVTGTLHVRLARAIREHPVQTIAAGRASESNVPGVNVSYELDNTGTLHIYITGKDSVRKIQGVTCNAPDGRQLQTRGSGTFTSEDASFKNVTINFEDKPTALHVILKTYEEAQEVKLPLNFRVGMTGMLPPPKETEINRGIAPPKFKR